MLDLAQQRGEPPLILLLDVIQNPQNLGTLLRTAEAVGAHGVIIPQRRGVEVTQAVVNASSGASEHMLVAQVVNLVVAITELKEHEVWITGLDNLPEARPLDQADLRGAIGLVVGNEGEGMRRLVRESCDFLVKLPMRGQVDSLNAAVAGSIVMYEILRQRMKNESTNDASRNRSAFAVSLFPSIPLSLVPIESSPARRCESPPASLRGRHPSAQALPRRAVVPRNTRLKVRLVRAALHR